MMDAQSTLTKNINLMDMDEWIELFAYEPFEFIDGEKIPMSPSVAGSNYTAGLVYEALILAVKPQKLGEVIFEPSFAFVKTSQWVRKSLVPDVAFVSAEKLASYRAENPDWKVRPYTLIPDLVVEIVSSTDRKSDVRRKVPRYLEEGVQMVWVVDYINEVVEVFTTDGGHELRKSDTLTAGDIIPGFELTLETLFA
jgi:Uma2 family endonuclease